MARTALETAQSAVSILTLLVEILGPRGSIGPLGFANDHMDLVAKVKFCIDRTAPSNDLDRALAYLHDAKKAYAEWYNGSKLGDLNSAELVKYTKELCRMHLRMASAHIQKAVDDKIFEM